MFESIKHVFWKWALLPTWCHVIILNRLTCNETVICINHQLHSDKIYFLDGSLSFEWKGHVHNLVKRLKKIIHPDTCTLLSEHHTVGSAVFWNEMWNYGQFYAMAEYKKPQYKSKQKFQVDFQHRKELRRK